VTALPLPTRKDEAWRYSDLAALAEVWPLGIARETITLGDGETRLVTLVQDAEADAAAVRDYRITLGRGARLELYMLNTGGRFGRIAVEAELAEGADFRLGGAQIGDGRQTLEIVTEVRHQEPGATSRQTVRSVLGGRATGSYLGKVAVARDAQKTDAAQSVKAMLLDRTATANAKPELEIFADDVKCAHGATVGELDRNQYFYMISRGLPPAEAKRLMLRTFIADAFAEMPEGDEKAALEAAALSALERVT
jgi:Fe-S cluster assembly protein SufD